MMHVNSLNALINCAIHTLTRLFARERRGENIRPNLSRVNLMATFDITRMAVVQSTGARNLISFSHLLLLRLSLSPLVRFPCLHPPLFSALCLTRLNITHSLLCRHLPLGVQISYCWRAVYTRGKYLTALARWHSLSRSINNIIPRLQRRIEVYKRDS